MGILNATPDSFSDGGEYLDRDAALQRIDEMVEEGARIIDIGGESTRPGSEPVSAEEEIGRTIPLLKEAVPRHKEIVFSIDTTKYEVARLALEAGAHMVNDVSGLRKEPRFAELCADSGAAYVCMHSIADPKTMQDKPEYEDVIDEITRFFEERSERLEKAGVESVILDPGIGFGKTLDHNLAILANLESFLPFRRPLLIGASRKSMIGQILGNRPAEDRLIGTISVHYHSMMLGAQILRVHDVKEAVDSVEIYHAIKTHTTLPA
ncbi:MAG: dihydropteroate synthase [Bacteroidetes bacterium]|nr:MAG: dihydropteroate synthase [Bacteroidota bacterium]PTM20660.1 MAG: dihydropteroate synthase [Bacteroidota bacterium]